MNNAPCKDCKDRERFCHSTCERYKAFKEELTARKRAAYRFTPADKIGAERVRRKKEKTIQKQKRGVTVTDA